MGTLDYMKRFLDDEADTLYSRGDTATFAAGQANQVKEFRNALRDRMKTVVPQYGTYLDSYSGSSGMIDALTAGRGSAAGARRSVQGYDDLDPETIAAQQGKRTVAEQELYRVGVARNLLDKIKGTGDNSNAASRLLRNDTERDQLLATGVSPAGVGRLDTSVKQERQLNQLSGEMAGSQSAQRIIAQADADAGMSLSLPFNVASKPGWIGSALRGVTERASLKRNASVNQELLPRMLETDPKTIEGIIQGLEQQGNVAMAQSLRLQLKQRRAGLVGGGMVGSPVALQPEDQ